MYGGNSAKAKHGFWILSVKLYTKGVSMDRPSRTQAIARMLNAYTHADLASLYHHDFECQVNVAQDGGTRVEGMYEGRQWHGWSDSSQTWKSFRIPYKAMSDPEYNDTPMNFDLESHVEGIGMTGWNWVARASFWVAFDFDAITGHSDKHAKKLSQAELDGVVETLNAIPWCTIRRSTSGKGLHVYVFLKPVPTSNHTEHAALARAILGQLSAMTKCDFSSKVDICGGNMWVWHRKMKGTDGLKLLKAGIVLDEPPMNWKDHIEVCKGNRRKTRPTFVGEGMDQAFEDLTGQQSRVPLDDEHRKLFQWLKDNNRPGEWNQDHWMLVAHTHDLKDAHTSLGMRGLFETTTTHSSDVNCFGFPMRHGAWALRRYSQGVKEHSMWDQDGKGWTRCYLNREPTLKAAARTHDGEEHPTGGYAYKNAGQAMQTALALGAKVELPNWILTRPARVKEHKDGRLVMEIDQYDKQDSGMGGMESWIVEKGKYKKVLDVKSHDATELDVSTFDDLVRHIVSPNGDDCGWVIKSQGSWKCEPLTHVKHALMAMAFNPQDINTIIGTNIMKCWTLVNRPFQDEYPAGREWNRNAAQFRYKPTEDIDNLTYPTWTSILDHVGKSLDKPVKEHPWCVQNCIQTGGDYLKCWIASMFQHPLEPLPYLFLFGDPNAGKSILHEAISLLVTHGVVRADQALTSTFNGELANAILCVIEEVDLRKNKQAYNKMKDWVTARQLSIRALYESPYLIPNATHWIQCANDFMACPILPGDARIVYINVDTIPAEKMIPKRQLIVRLEKEAPDFLAAILKLEIPTSPDRLMLPVIATEEKNIAEDANQTLLQHFVTEHCHHVTGRMIKYGEFFERFQTWLSVSDRHEWTKIKVGRELPPKHPKGRVMAQGAQYFIGNISWEPFKPGDEVLPRIVRKDDALVVEK